MLCGKKGFIKSLERQKPVHSAGKNDISFWGDNKVINFRTTFDEQRINLTDFH